MWWTGGALGFDTETDGPEPAEARIITAATVSLETAGTYPREIMLKPERDIPQDAINVHGITTERAREEGMDRREGVLLTARALAELTGPERPLVGHNVAYDLTLLDREMRRTGVGRLEVDRPAGGTVLVLIDGETAGVFPVLDSLVIDKAVDRYRPGKRKLDVTAAHYGVPMAEGAAHGATADVFASLRILWKIWQRSQGSVDQLIELYAERKRPRALATEFKALGAMDLMSLHQAQVRWAREQADGLREYFVQQHAKGVEGAGDPDSVDGSWPLRRLTGGASAVETVDTTLV